MATGKVARFFDQKGFGFIQPDGGGKDLFVHINEVEGGQLQEGDNVEFDDDDTSGGLFLGWRPIELIGAEVGYYDFGEQEADNGTKIEGGAVPFAGLLSFELGPVGLYGKGGVANTDFDVKHPSFKDDESSTDAFGGVGATIDLMDKLYVYGEFMHFDNDAGIDMFGAGLRFQF